MPPAPHCCHPLCLRTRCHDGTGECTERSQRGGFFPFSSECFALLMFLFLAVDVGEQEEKDLKVPALLVLFVCS
uniref:Uncharacterized protein n=1 Tax=Arundo donax TaxID=35708 RepID=A0A0A9ACR6_ARUDO